MTICHSLREANVVRQAEWDTGGDITLSYTGNELAGEVGEALELIDTAASYDALRAGLCAELSDVVICCDLTALRLGLDIHTVVEIIEETSPSLVTTDRLFVRLGAATGRACNIVKKLERERFGMVGSRSTPDDLRRELNMVVQHAFEIAKRFDIGLKYEVAKKFNGTSVKNGLATRLEYA